MSAVRIDKLLAQIRDLSPADRRVLVERASRELGQAEPGPDPLAFVGMFADEPALIAEVCEDAMRARERDPDTSFGIPPPADLLEQDARALAPRRQRVPVAAQPVSTVESDSGSMSGGSSRQARSRIGPPPRSDRHWLYSSAGHDQKNQPIFDDTNVPVFWATLQGATHTGTAVGNIGGYRGPATAWFRLHLMGDEDARDMFFGSGCGLCSNSSWVVQRKGIQQGTAPQRVFPGGNSVACSDPSGGGDLLSARAQKPLSD